jgi:hypothetical protein
MFWPLAFSHSLAGGPFALHLKIYIAVFGFFRLLEKYFFIPADLALGIFVV